MALRSKKWLWASLGFGGLSLTVGWAAIQSVIGYGPNPILPFKHQTLFSTVNIAPAVGWNEGRKPQAVEGFNVAPFALGLTHPRWLYVLPNGDVLVAETNGPGEPPRSLRGLIMKRVMKRATGGVPSPNRIMLLRDGDGDGVAETKTVFLENLFSPFGMALVGNDLYVANTDAVMRFPYTPGATKITARGMKLVDLPAFPLDHHWTKNVFASKDGSKLYVTLGSNSNVGENG